MGEYIGTHATLKPKLDRSDARRCPSGLVEARPWELSNGCADNDPAKRTIERKPLSGPKKPLIEMSLDCSVARRHARIVALPT